MHVEHSLTHNPNDRLPASLPVAFRWIDARSAGLTDRRLRRLVEGGTISRLGRGLYQRTDSAVGDLEVIEAALTGRDATLCLASALSHADLIDEIPFAIDIALPRGTRNPEISLPITWHRFSRETFNIGRIPKHAEGGLPIASYSPERSICDAYRLRHTQGVELGRQALKNWLRQPGSHPAALLDIAAHFPKANPAIRRELEILL
jgi:hypothetical protein